MRISTITTSLCVFLMIPSWSVSFVLTNNDVKRHVSNCDQSIGTQYCNPTLHAMLMTKSTNEDTVRKNKCFSRSVVIDDNTLSDLEQGVNGNVLTTRFMAMASLCALLVSPFAVYAVSGGGLDYAGTDISGQNFSNGNYKGKDFTQGMKKNLKKHLWN